MRVAYPRCVQFNDIPGGICHDSIEADRQYCAGLRTPEFNRERHIILGADWIIWHSIAKRC
jgi:hypothetical protein